MRDRTVTLKVDAYITLKLNESMPIASALGLFADGTMVGFEDTADVELKGIEFEADSVVVMDSD